MAIQSKKSQFFLMSLVLVYLAIIVIFTYIRSADYASVSLFSKDTTLELENFIDGATTQTSWLPDGGATHWMSTNPWMNRKLIAIKWTAANAASYTVEINPSLTAADLENCTEEIRVYANSTRTEIAVNVTSTTPPCNIVWTMTTLVQGTTYYYYIYYNNQGYTIAPAARSSSASGNTNAKFSAYIGSAEECPPLAFCTHLADIYPRMGIDLNCTVNTTAGPLEVVYVPKNFTLLFTATDLEFNGSVY